MFNMQLLENKMRAKLLLSKTCHVCNFQTVCNASRVVKSIDSHTPTNDNPSYKIYICTTYKYVCHFKLKLVSFLTFIQS